MPNEIKDSELSKKAYAEKYDYTIHAVNEQIRNNKVKWRYLFPDTEEYIVIDTSYVYKNGMIYKTNEK